LDLFFIYQDDTQSNTHQIFFYLVFPRSVFHWTSFKSLWNCAISYW